LFSGYHDQSLNNTVFLPGFSFGGINFDDPVNEMAEASKILVSCFAV
jgi:hypothetical protein